MVIFDQLRISDDGKELYISVHINDAVQQDYATDGYIKPFEKVYLKSLTIVSADKVSETSTSVPTKGILYYMDFEKVFGENTKSASLVIHDWELKEQPTVDEEDKIHNPCAPKKLVEGLFFVYVETKGDANDCVPCIYKNPVATAVVFDETLLYQKAMNYTRELVQDCNVPQGFADFILQWNAFKSSVETEHWNSAIKFYNMLFGATNTPVTTATKGCGCHG